MVSMFMKVAITGHTGEIGTHLAQAFTDAGNEVVGITRSLGYDLTTEMGILRAVEVIKDCDIFVNLAWPPTQVKILEYVWDAWQGDRSKTIINVGTTSTVLPSYKLKNIQYYKIKKQLDDKHWNLVDKGHYPKMTLVRAGMGVNESSFQNWAYDLVKLLDMDCHIFEITYGRLGK